MATPAPAPATAPAAVAIPPAAKPSSPPPAASAAPRRTTLLVCADPADLPYSDEASRGYENALFEIVGRALAAEVDPIWIPDTRARAAELLGTGRCDFIVGVPTDTPGVLLTRPWYRTTHVLVQKPARNVVRRLDDPALRRMSIGVEAPDRNAGPTPAGRALAQAGLAKSVVAFPTRPPNAGPAGAAVHAVARGDIDIALVLGPQAAFHAAAATPPLTVTRPQPPRSSRTPAPQLDRDFAMAVARDRSRLRDALDAVLQRYRTDIDRILAAYSVPRTDVAAPRSR